MSTAFSGQARIPSIVVVDPRFDAYKSLSVSARTGRIALHFRSSGADALKLARRLPVDAWLVAPELDDMSGHDLVRLLQDVRGAVTKAAPVALVESKDGRGAETVERVPGSPVLSHPITLADLEELLGLPAEQRSKLLATAGNVGRSFVTFPIGVGAAAIAIAVLMMT